MIRTRTLIGMAALIACTGRLSAAETAAPAGASQEATNRTSPVPSPARAPLDLRAPDVTKVYTPEQIQAVLAKSLDRNIEEIEVEGNRERGPLEPRTPRVWPSIAAPFWALLHPTQAWRIIAPLPPDQARLMDVKPDDATSGYLEPAAADARR